ncbi:hypothetical protein O181_019279 [Austropuccinia psidii MF-1]|uniref:Uncharacterized protein n=1 Tax=Austropuccinia psidii MF-1 TaxID=1389203 RepID=A0A9Q3C6S5_9BASI|nr:hypothetical protein [Austropuccinia psidii MF-1]
MKFVQVIVFVFAASYIKGSIKVSKPIIEDDAERKKIQRKVSRSLRLLKNCFNAPPDFRVVNVEDSSENPPHLDQTSAIKKARNYGFQMSSTVKEESNIQKQLLLNQEKIQKLAQGYKSMKKSMNILKNKELLKHESWCNMAGRNVKLWERWFAQAQTNHYGVFHLGWSDRFKRKCVRVRKRFMYAKALRELIGSFKSILNDLDQVHREIIALAQTYLTQLAGLSSALLFTRPASSNSVAWRSKLLQCLSHSGLEGTPIIWKVGPPKNSPRNQGILPENIINTINEIRINDVVKELNRILRELNKLSINARSSRDENEQSLSTRVLFETYIFQALNFLYENKLCDQKVVKTFFSTENTLERTYEHLRDLFKRRKRKGEVSYFTLMPELSFVLNDWNTAHLHNLIRG